MGVAGARIRNCPAGAMGLRRERLSFSLCLPSFSAGGDIPDDGTVIAQPPPSRYQAGHKNGINISLGLVTLARRPQALAIDRLKPCTKRTLALDRAAVLARHCHRLALRGDLLGQFLVQLGAQAQLGTLIHSDSCHTVNRVAGKRG
jgi:hypothetical protein